jgi:hypothetical protein
MIEEGEGLSFAGEAFGEPSVAPSSRQAGSPVPSGGVVAKVWWEDFEGNGTVESDLTGEIDGPHAAPADERGDFEFREEGCEVGG